MANSHFGEIGDVWKHLVVGEVLDRVRPTRYWETHAGSGTYVLDRSWEREYGIYALLREAPRAPAIEASRYLWLVRTLPPGDDGQPRYPGSARLAMEVLGDASTYLLCDLDPTSVADLARSARELDLVDLVRVQRADGLATIWDSAQDLSPESTSSTMVLIDPFDETERSAEGMDALELFAGLAAAGFPTMLWHGYDDAADRDAIRLRGTLEGLPTQTLDIETSFLRGESTLNPGVGGCGVFLANASSGTVEHLERLGRQLAACYDEALMPDGTSGALRFALTDLG
ncbi:MAG: 23S rRNA (adenine(2030)-N(6))-methyltransferase RlmJ [Actinomycetota bacterium]|nr:23S rRNA (adenine(2030)-N(6))-methyltransferase RlmJ [Actinomycetota bacterium]MDH5223683.1 23S rRNA (adenine(2030)-N(6))-methyltransferase RlmJ [Actinomycetota bacterium]MDH5312287.1 23S rRNA (adenine(2030)-N(6))-methyltransferase RlmJ [Actinomycetota bacterium]